MGRKWGVPIALGILTFVLLLVSLWPRGPETVKVVVAATDLGAGVELTPADLQVVEMPRSQVPPDAVGDPSRLVGQTLAVVRYQGEPITPRHLGPAVQLRPDERGMAVRVRADTGLAGLLRPGMKVGVVATLEQGNGGLYAKALIEGLRVLYVPPEFQSRPYRPLTGEVVVSSQGGSGRAQPPSSPPPSAAGQVREGVIVLAVPTAPQRVVYETYDSLRQRMEKTAAAGGAVEIEARTLYVSPVELLAALNARGDALTLVLTPEKAGEYVTTGLALDDLVVEETLPEAGREGGGP